MTRRLLVASLCATSMFALALAAGADEPAAKGKKAKKDNLKGFVELFNGKDLSGWTQYNGKAEYWVEDGAICGKTVAGSPNSFLCSDKDYGDFVLTFEVQVDPRLNSGVQLRSKTEGGERNPEGRVHGPQCEIEQGPAEAGYIYGEALGTGWLTNPQEPKTELDGSEWTKFRVVARGPKITTFVNDKKVASLDYEKLDDKARNILTENHLSGFLGLQVHSFKGDSPAEVRWRNILIKETKAKDGVSLESLGKQADAALDSAKETAGEVMKKGKKAAQDAGEVIREKVNEAAEAVEAAAENVQDATK